MPELPAADLPMNSLVVGDPGTSSDAQAAANASAPTACAAAANAQAADLTCQTEYAPADAQPVPASGEPVSAAAEPGMSPAECGAELAERFPGLFAGAPKPIKLRIHADIQARAPGIFTRRTLSFFFSRYTTTTAYLKALLAHPQRFDLDGQPVGEVSTEHRSAAEAELARRRKVFDERRAAERAMHEARAARGAKSSRMRPAEGPAPAAVAPGRVSRTPPTPHDAAAGPAPREALPPQRSAAQVRLAAESARRSSAARSLPRQPARQAAPSAGAPAARHASRPGQPEAVEGPVDTARQDRLQLLRAWESSPLTKANFCVLRRITPEALDAAIAAEQAPKARPAVHAGPRAASPQARAPEPALQDKP